MAKELSVEEAWAARENSHFFVHTGTVNQTAEQDRLSREQAARATKVGWMVERRAIEGWGRALALAVLDGAENSGCIYPGCDHPCTTCPIDKLRAKIEAPGR